MKLIFWSYIFAIRPVCGKITVEQCCTLNSFWLDEFDLCARTEFIESLKVRNIFHVFFSSPFYFKIVYIIYFSFIIVAAVYLILHFSKRNRSSNSMPIIARMHKCIVRHVLHRNESYKQTWPIATCALLSWYNSRTTSISAVHSLCWLLNVDKWEYIEYCIITFQNRIDRSIVFQYFEWVERFPGWRQWHFEQYDAADGSIFKMLILFQ